MVTQVVHIPALNALSDFFETTYLYDVSEEALRHSQRKSAGTSPPKATRNVQELCNSPEVDLVLIASNHVFHASHALLALRANKHVFIEKPIALTLEDTDSIIAEDEAVGGSKVFVGYMRRYAAAFVDAIKEVGDIGQIRYARVRDIIGPNSTFVLQSGTYPKTFNDYPKADSEALQRKTAEDLEQVLKVELGLPSTEQTKMTWEWLSTLGSHDLSAMREMLGMPKGAVGFSPCATVGSPFWRSAHKTGNDGIELTKTVRCSNIRALWSDTSPALMQSLDSMLQ